MKERVTTNVYKPVKSIMHDLKKQLRLKNESEVIAYLFAIYEIKRNGITLNEHQRAIDRIKEIHRQMTI